MSSFIIKTCTVADGPAIGRNNVAAFWTDKTWIQIWGDRTQEHVAEQAAKRGRRNLLLDRAHRRHLQAVDAETGAVVGYARWVLPDGGCSGDDSDPCHRLWTEAQIPDVDEEVRREAERQSASADWTFTRGPIDGIDAPIEAMTAKLRAGKRYMVLDYLCVPPAFRRRGIASALVRRGLEEAEKLGFDTFVLAMRAGLRVYQKAGFVLLDHVLIDATEYGGDKDYGGWCLEKKCVSTP
ncbi:acyl-CoA N-acyltransferase [Coniochaeta ligniaria NRRL 30616]|uniref:Acyl-CoA N-acyltransferase n=1 Tax=Coniochaeta ligniaria NRRL 30616 TaxID=1408157 RepID=A0A1J7IMF8_9PEZI|nr:acyl-CoA N-acyltransferase [Coniochaeta ligniaria NRRL 30616]